MVVQRRKKEVNLSVLNTDKYDRLRFEKIHDMSEGLQRVTKSVDIPHFKALVGDIWASLYKIEPAINDEQDIEGYGLGINKVMMDRVLNDEKYEEIHSSTMLDDLVSAVASKSFAVKVNDWVEEQKKQNQELAEKIEQLKQEKKSVGKGKAQRVREAQKDIQDCLEQVLTQDSDQLMDGFIEATKEGQNVKNTIESLISMGDEAGKAKSALEQVPLADQLKLADAVRGNQQLKKVADWAGRFKNIAQKKQKSKKACTQNRDGVTVGNEIEKLLPTELLMYANQSTKLNFLRRYAENQTLSYDFKGKDELGKGPIIAAVDESGSMREIKEQSKGFILALMGIARRQKRDFALVRFSTEVITTEYPKGKIDIEEMASIATSFLSGGTDFKKPLLESVRIINKSRFKKADLVFITDGSERLSEDFLKSFSDIKYERDFKVLSLVLSKNKRLNTDTVKKFSDKIVTIEDFEDQNAYEAFEI